MFTGIVQGTASVVATTIKNNFMQLTLAFPQTHCDNLQTGASIAINGTCLTITAFKQNQIQFDLIMETLRVTNLGKLKPGDRVNFERAARIGEEIGGHLMSGHIHAQVTISQIEQPADNRIIWFDTTPDIIKYILPKGFVALNGCSLTIGEVVANRFNIYLIPETLSVTLFGQAAVGDHINLEIDSQTQAIIDTVERYMQHNR
ncbi:riboflavin synthase subunit alpha [Amphritea sp. 1_MG-2023]|uniref:riboflavin synthase subunit alpha n=1 Tax=Amphritea sp. 1_MG-2023 TaxID=3062670 RepID=UPI0026E3FFB3|nr:riboflavin synthase subunit alpha [Amphritea sp. 1_MG-2023]MDO6562239.1 riboflavin synthase subunit alpha [Amphritea sp. 1_MG-2023]